MFDLNTRISIGLMSARVLYNSCINQKGLLGCSSPSYHINAELNWALKKKRAKKDAAPAAKNDLYTMFDFKFYFEYLNGAAKALPPIKNDVKPTVCEFKV